MSYKKETSPSVSAMIGKVNSFNSGVMSSMSLIHLLWESTSSADKPINLVFLASNSFFKAAKAPNSVVQIGVKSRGWEKRMVHLSPIHSWKLILPTVVSTSKFGAVEPILSFGCSSALNVLKPLVKTGETICLKAPLVDGADLNKV
ncbi:hypothetical protein WICPIJ_008216 [Wickerhamomyces pijperi]|uniref:Uncharacterized protein n=1 Tax=Wickerhamomyces pijperi TaxID=599730 RepID=A0A9P8TJ06_WICPI|nr:hypothetical protein WICPIJ_008216 [Wickerhamomyces pijperi]